MAYGNRTELKKLEGKIGTFYNEESEKVLIFGKLKHVTGYGNCETEDGTLYDNFTPLTRAQALEMLDLELYNNCV